MVPPNVIDLGVGQPDATLLPLTLVRQATEHRLKQTETSLLAYGPSQGDGYFLRTLAAYLTAQYGQPVSHENLIVTSGNSQAIDLISTLFARTGDTIFVEEPSYSLALSIFHDHRFNLVSLPLDDEGLVVSAVEAALQTHRPAFLYTVPTFHNPATVTLSAARRAQLAELSAKHDLLIVADEVYHFLDYANVAPPPMASYIEQGRIIALGSFSKMFAPGLRLGWLHTSAEIRQHIAQCGLLDSGGSANHFASAIGRSLLELGLLDQYLATLKQHYGQRAAALATALRQHLPQASFRQPEGGYFLWVTLPDGVDTGQLLTEHAPQFEVGFQAGVNYSSREGLRQQMRLCFTFYDTPQLTEGVKRLAQMMATVSG